jgi:hypothetical protein
MLIAVLPIFFTLSLYLAVWDKVVAAIIVHGHSLQSRVSKFDTDFVILCLIMLALFCLCPLRVTIPS